MDLGVYTLALCVALFGEPKTAQSASVMLDTGVDVSSSSILLYDGFLVNLAYAQELSEHDYIRIISENTN